jgi:hypothetical protein
MFAHYTMHAKLEASGTCSPYPLDSKMLRRPLYWEMRPVRRYVWHSQQRLTHFPLVGNVFRQIPTTDLKLSRTWSPQLPRRTIFREIEYLHSSSSQTNIPSFTNLGPSSPRFWFWHDGSSSLRDCLALHIRHSSFVGWRYQQPICWMEILRSGSGLQESSLWAMHALWSTMLCGTLLCLLG